jgi:putative ABC transport system permease protein
MRLWQIAWRSIGQRALASSLTGLSMALGVMLVVAVLVIHGVVDKSFLNDSGLGYNIVVGAKGGRLELVLNSVYYLAPPVENIPYTYYLEFVEGKLKPYVDKAIPLCLGDVYGDFRVIGTTPAFFNDLDYGGHKYEFAEGRNFEPDEYFGAVVGATAAREMGLKKGDEFQPSHGVGPEAHKHDAFTVLGVLKPTGTPNDRALFINMEGFYLIPEHAKPVDSDAPPVAQHAHEEHDEAAHKVETASAEHKEADHEHPEHHDEAAGDENAHEAQADADHKHDEHAHDEHAHDAHDHHHHDHGHDHHHDPLPIEQREVTAVLILTAGAGNVAPGLLYGPELMKAVNKDAVAQAVLPIREMSKLFMTFVDPLRYLLLSLTVTIIVVSGIGILVSIYNSMSERRHEIAVMRALGAGRRTVMFVVLLESILLSLLGGLAGWAVGHLLIGVLSPWIAVQTGVNVSPLQFVGYELVIIPGLIVLASLVGYLPAMAAYRTDVAKALSATP